MEVDNIFKNGACPRHQQLKSYHTWCRFALETPFGRKHLRKALPQTGLARHAPFGHSCCFTSILALKNLTWP